MIMKRYKVKENHLTLQTMMTILLLLCLILVLGGCGEEKKTQAEPDFNENGLFVSDAFSYEELKEYYSQNKDVALNDAEGKLAQMDITENDEGTYRVVTQKIADTEKSAPFIEFYLKTNENESEETYTIEKIQKA